MDNNTQSRRRFLWLGAGVAGAVAIFPGLKFFTRSSKKKDTAKMLTRDGRLVEIDASMLKNAGKKASNKDLQEWIKR
jgi:hypothetical protein